ncbi:MAG: hypothetical protein CVU97_01200 [Firmicutes bacterium HGW-Firmicutes-21]|nr:MAG: hypothetical protein CVU97_01200 [Firmicutes bacterium HGW-Firmicutes-21]
MSENNENNQSSEQPNLEQQQNTQQNQQTGQQSYTPPSNHQYINPQYNQGYDQFNNPYIEPAKGMAIASLVLGIVSFLCFAYITGVLAIIFGAVAKSKGNKSGKATAGIVCGILGIVSWVALLIFWGNIMTEMFSQFMSILVY